jgi:hypothetical protein
MSNLKSIQEMNAEWDAMREAKFRPQWIKCNERMPEDGVYVLIDIGCDDPPRCGIAKYRDGLWWEMDGYSRISGVTHWQVLPPPPENDNG